MQPIPAPAPSSETGRTMSFEQTEQSSEQAHRERRESLRLDRHRLRVLEPLRVHSGLSRRRAARRIGVSRGVLRSWEDQRSVPTASGLDAAIDLYGTGLEDLLGSRQPLESPDEPGVLFVGEHRIDTNTMRLVTPDLAECNRRILSSYLDAVRRARGYRDDERPALRSDDLIELARVLDVSDHHLDRLLAVQLDLDTATARRTSRALMVAGLMNTSILRGPTAGWIHPGGTTTDHFVPANEMHRRLFATVPGSSPDTALRVQMFSIDRRPSRGEVATIFARIDTPGLPAARS